MNELLCGDARELAKTLPNDSVHCIITSPPYFGLRDYGTAQWEGGDDRCDHVEAWNLKRDCSGGVTGRDKGTRGKQPHSQSSAIQYRDICAKCGAIRIDRQIGLESSMDEYIAELVTLFSELRRVLHPTGTVWINLGDSFCDKQLQGIPWRVALALQQDGWWLRCDLIWHKKSPMPSSAMDRPTIAHEYLFLLSKASHYFYDAVAVAEPAKHQGKVVSLGDKSFSKGQANGLGIAPSGNGAADTYTVSSTRNMRSVLTLGPEPFSGWTETSHRVRVVRGALSGGMKHTVFPDCPLHGSLCRQDSIQQYDEHAIDSLNHNGHIDDHPDQEQSGDCVPTDPIHATETQEQSLDLHDPQYSLFAIDHSRQKSKTDRARPTSEHDNVCAQRKSHIQSNQPSHEHSDSVDHKRENNTSAGETDDSHNSQISSRSVDIPLSPGLYGASVISLIDDGCICEFYTEATKKASHFATFPRALVKPCLLAGTSARGVCPACLAPWERVVEKDVHIHGNGRTHIAGGWDHGWEGTPRASISTITTGWQPTCTCDAGEPVPATVLDPFIGSGTVASVAVSLGRNWLGFELNPEYIDLAYRRIYATQPALLTE